MKSFSEASERNRGPILAVLRRWLNGTCRVLEIGSGNGQHAVYFAAALPRVFWQATDRAECLPDVSAWIEEAALPNLGAATALDVNDEGWPAKAFDAVFAANTAHIMSWPEVELMITRSAAALRPGGLFFLYGPFNYGGRFTSESNARFDAWLRAREAHMGVRDVEAVDARAGAAGLALIEDNAMPSNNRLLVWRRNADAPQAGPGGERS